MIRTLLQRLRPTVLAAVIVLGTIGMTALFLDQQEVAAICATGIVAIAKDIVGAEEKSIEAEGKQIEGNNG